MSSTGDWTSAYDCHPNRTSPEDGARHAERIGGFKRLGRLNRNIGKIDQEISELVA